MSITATNIMDLVKQDLRDTFASSGTTSVLLEYIDRVQQTILRRRRWDWVLSTPQRFMTERGQPNYWIGATASVVAGEVDTALNLTDVRRVKANSVLARSSRTQLWRLDEAPLDRTYQNPDASYSEGPPTQFRNDEARRGLITLYPAPDAGSDYVVVPPAPHSTTAAGGALAARTYFLRTAFVDLAGNVGAASNPARQYVEASKLITVKAPQPAFSSSSSGITWLRYNVYASTTEDAEKLQTPTPIATSADWTEAASGLTTTGVAYPTSSAIEPLRGYVIEFRYEKAHTHITAGADVLLIPDDYRDVVVAGVNALAQAYRGKMDDAERWRKVFEAGMMEMVRNQNPWTDRRFLKPPPGTFRKLW